MRKKNIKLLILLVVMLLFSGCQKSADEKQASAGEDKEFTIVTSFYPIFVETLNIAKDIKGVRVVNMTKPQTGCLHDYSLTPADLKTLEGADVFVVNGAGMEAFMDKVVSQQSNLKIIEASKGIRLVKNLDGEENPHIWVSISDCILQVKNIGEKLAAIDPQNAEAYKNNTDRYVKKLEIEKNKMHQILDNVKTRDIITFHEAFPYFAEEFNLHIAAVIEREPGSEPTPKELEDTIDIIKKSKIKVVFVEPQYSSKSAQTIAAETGVKIYDLDPVVTGDGSLNSYIETMDKNLKTLQEALK